MNAAMLAHVHEVVSGKRVLVTGHTGFKGAWLCLWLHQLGAEVHGLALDPPSSPSAFDVTGIGKLLASDRRHDGRDAAEVHATLDRVAPEIVFTSRPSRSCARATSSPSPPSRPT